MGTVIDLPSRAEQGMEFLESEIRKLMAEKGESAEATDIALDTLKDVYSRYSDIGKQQFSLTLPASLNEDEVNAIRQQVYDGIHILNEEHSHMLNRLAAELVLTKIQLLKALNK